MKLSHKGPIPCPVKGCTGRVVWYGEHELSLTGKCLTCNSGFTLLLTSRGQIEEKEGAA